MKATKPYMPVATLQQMIDYRPDQPETYTPSPLVNAVADVLYTTKLIRCGEIADYLGIKKQTVLSEALLLETGMNLLDIVTDYRLNQARQYAHEHPEADQEEISKEIGYASAGSLWRLFQRKSGETPTGKRSQAVLEKRKSLTLFKV